MAGTDIAEGHRLAGLCATLQASLAAHPETARLAGADLVPMRDKGLAHDHVRIGATGWLARVPKQSQMDLPPEANLAYQEACFRRAHASGHTPALLAVLPPRPGLAQGALVVEAIAGRPARKGLIAVNRAQGCKVFVAGFFAHRIVSEVIRPEAKLSG
jgi:hypothetical protein